MRVNVGLRKVLYTPIIHMGIHIQQDVLKDKHFQLDRDFDVVLRKFKGQSMRRPVRPIITVIDSATNSKSARKVLK